MVTEGSVCGWFRTCPLTKLTSLTQNDAPGSLRPDDGMVRNAYLLLVASLAAQLPEAGAKDEGHCNGKGESGGVVVGRAPVGDVELPQADAVLLQQAAGVHRVKLEGGHPGVWLAALLNDLLHSPAGKARL